MIKRILAIAFIFGCTSIAWMFLGGTITARTSSTSERLRGRVQSVWGTPQEQSAPMGEYDETGHYQETVTENGHSKVIEKAREETHTVRPEATAIAVDLRSEPRRKGLL